MILILRGHIRNSFETRALYDLVKAIHTVTPGLRIYIHTWNIFANGVSWRKMDTDTRKVNKEAIYAYFGDLKRLIKHILIDDDSRITLIGNLRGKINNGPMPILGWKNYWYGKYKIIDYIRQQGITEDIVVNTRFDVITNSCALAPTSIIDFIQKNRTSVFTRNIFIHDIESCGIDNIYIGSVETMHSLTSKFFFNLDSILKENNDTINQEKLVFRLNSKL